MPMRVSADSRNLTRQCLLALSAIMLCIAAAPAAAQMPQLTHYNSRFYDIHTNLAKREAQAYGRHMDLIFAEYRKRFADFKPRNQGRMRLFLLRSEQDYHAFMAELGISAQNSGCMFFVRPNARGLATWTEGRSRAAAFAVLQHEGFHQFAYEYIGNGLPTWVNEGIAQYFEDGVVVTRGTRQSIELGLANMRRAATVKAAIENDELIDCDALLNRTGDQWSANLRTNPALGRLQYDQAWSVTYFLIHGDDGRYRQAFANYVMLLSQGRDQREAFAHAFGSTDTEPFRKAWERFAREHKPDPLTAGLIKLEFLGQGLRFLQGRGEAAPGTIDELRERLTAIGFGARRWEPGMVVEFKADEGESYEFLGTDGKVRPFQLLEAAGDRLLPRIAAPGLKPQPTLIWMLNDDGELISDIEFN